MLSGHGNNVCSGGGNVSFHPTQPLVQTYPNFEKCKFSVLKRRTSVCGALDVRLSTSRISLLVQLALQKN